MSQRIPTPLLIPSLFLLLFAAAGCWRGTDDTPEPAATAAVPPRAASSSPGPGGPPGIGDADSEAEPLLVWVDASVENGKAPLTVEFKADVEGGTTPLKYGWVFGDGTPTSAEPNPSHTYASPGSYRAELSVKDSGDDTDMDYVMIEVE